MSFFILYSIGSYSQTKIVQTNNLVIAFKEDNVFNWQKPSPQSLIIKIKKKGMIVYSSEVQKYKFIDFNGEYKDGVKRWYGKDEKDLTCYIYISKVDQKTKEISIGVEYDDIAFYYTGNLK